MTKLETAKIVGIIGAMYQSYQVTDEKINIWHMLIKDIDYRHAQQALVECLKTSKYPPVAAEVIEKAGAIRFIESRTGGNLLDCTGNSVALKEDERSIYKDQPVRRGN